jgi:hypothetical protein
MRSEHEWAAGIAAVCFTAAVLTVFLILGIEAFG